jgi:hypothetical protein
MSTQLHSAMKEILAMPYYKNEHAQSGGAKYAHEDAVAVRIKNAGFTEFNKSSFKGLTKSKLKHWAHINDSSELAVILASLPNGSYILQPAGSQGFPDILVKDFCSRLVAVECKSGKDSVCPMWNDNVPQPLAIYVLSSGAVNETTLFMGRDVITEESYNIMAQQEAEIDKIVKKYAKIMNEADTFKRGFIQKSRKQHFQQGGGVLTNYFTHADRSKCEANALKYAEE